MEKSFDIELVNQNEYLVRWASEGRTGESLVHTNRTSLPRWAWAASTSS